MGGTTGITRTKIFGIVRNHEDAEDALQDTLLRAYTHLDSFRRSCKFATWLTAIGVNSALMILAETKGSQRNLCDYEQSGYGTSGIAGARRPVTRT